MKRKNKYIYEEIKNKKKAYALFVIIILTVAIIIYFAEWQSGIKNRERYMRSFRLTACENALKSIYKANKLYYDKNIRYISDEENIINLFMSNEDVIQYILKEQGNSVSLNYKQDNSYYKVDIIYIDKSIRYPYYLSIDETGDINVSLIPETEDN